MHLLKDVLDIFGATILVPVVVFILSVIMKVEVKRAFQGALYMGIGLAAFNVILSGLMGSLSPIVMEMVKNTGINLPIIDVGWPAAAMIVYANQIGFIYLVLGVGFDLVLFLTKWTDTFHPTDIWNYYTFVFWAAIVQAVTGSLALGLACAMTANLFVLLLADWLAPSLQERYGYEGITTTTFPPLNGAPFAVLMKWVLMKLHVYEIQLDADTLQRRFGFWGEPVTMGVIIGLLITLIAKFTQLGSATAWATILQTGIIVGAIMGLYPAVSGLFVKGLIPITQTLNARLRSGEIKRKNFNISIDPAVFFGESSTLTAGLVLMPIIMIIAVFQPGNGVLPLADLPAMPFMLIGIIAVMRGNILSAVITGAIWYSIGQWALTDVAASFTQVAQAAGVEIPAAGALVTSWSQGASPILWVLYKAYTAPIALRPVTIGLVFVVYFVLYYLFRKNRHAWHRAAGASEEFLNKKEALYKGNVTPA